MVCSAQEQLALSIKKKEHLQKRSQCKVCYLNASFQEQMLIHFFFC